MVFSSIIFKRDDGFGAKRWYFFELIAKRFDAFIRHSRVNTQENFAETQAIPKKLKQIPKKLKDLAKNSMYRRKIPPQPSKKP